MTVRLLSDGELQRLRYELGLNVLLIGAEPYIDHAQIPTLIQTYLASDAQAVAYSSTAVTATGVNTLTLDSVVGLSTGTPVLLDLDEFAERVTIRRVVGSTISVNCSLLHGANCPVEIESGLTMVRAKLAELAVLALKINQSADASGIKQVDEVIFKDGVITVASELAAHQLARRRELASLCNLQQILEQCGMGGNGARGFAPY